MGLEYVPAERISLKNHPDFNERWLQDRIIEDPSLLGLGDVDLKDVERVQPRAGRLDLLLYDAESDTRFEVELQLGASDESHIIRTIEYWDLERRRYPQYDHVGVIVAEDITARFFNVIGLFNGFIPLIAIQLEAVQVEDRITLVFSKVLDRTLLGHEDDDATSPPADRAYWEQRSAPATIEIVDHIGSMIRVVDPDYEPKYNKHYIGSSRRGVVDNYLAMIPVKSSVQIQFRIPRDEELTQRLEAKGSTYSPTTRNGANTDSA